MSARIRELAATRGDDAIYRHIGLDGAERTVTWEWLHRRSAQLAGALRERGVIRGGRLGWIGATRDRPAADLPDVVSPHVQGICSSGATGTPKIIHDEFRRCMTIWRRRCQCLIK